MLSRSGNGSSLVQPLGILTAHRENENRILNAVHSLTLTSRTLSLFGKGSLQFNQNQMADLCRHLQSQ